MTSEQLKTFLLIAEGRSFSSVAKFLFITQSSVSKRIRELEKEIGQPLFRRDRSGVYLTNAGKLMKRYAEQIMNLEKNALEQLHRTNPYAYHLTIGSVYAYYEIYLSAKIKLFSELFPNCSITVRFGHTSQLLNNLMKASIDIAFTHRPIDYSDYICRNVGHDDIVLVADSQNNNDINEIAYGDIKELPIIDTNFLYAPTRIKLFQLPHQSQITVDIASSAIPLLKGSNFFALLPFNLVRGQLKSGAFREIKITGERIPPVNHYMIYSKSLEVEPGVHEFITTLFKE